MPIRVELDKINDLLESLFILTDMTIALYDENFDFVESYPLYSRKSWFCAYIEHYPEFKNLCKKCDIKHFNIAKKSKKPIIYECHAGLLDIVFPLVQNNIVIGYITMGQVSANPDMDYIKKHLRSYFSTVAPLSDGLINASNQVIYKSTQQVRATIKLLELSINHILKNRLITSSARQLFDDLTTYIENNIETNLSINEICKTLNVSRTRLYAEMKKFLPQGVACYIKQKRLEKAKQFLIETDLSISRIAEVVGFNDYNYFLKSFKKAYGITPKQYRKA